MRWLDAVGPLFGLFHCLLFPGEVALRYVSDNEPDRGNIFHSVAEMSHHTSKHEPYDECGHIQADHYQGDGIVGQGSAFVRADCETGRVDKEKEHHEEHSNYRRVESLQHSQ